MTRPRHDDATHDDDFAAEIAWRLTSDRTGTHSLDEIFCDPAKSRHFDKVARRFVPDVPASRLRWAALRMRKARKHIVSEVSQYHYVLTRRDFSRYAQWHSCRPERFQNQSGVYMLRGRERRPIYIGAAGNLANRLERHRARSATARPVEQFSIIPQEELPSSEYLELLRVDLVRRYTPQLNVDLCDWGG